MTGAPLIAGPLVAVFPQTTQSLMTVAAEELERKRPPPTDAPLPVIVQPSMSAPEADEQVMPPPSHDVFP